MEVGNDPSDDNGPLIKTWFSASMMIPGGVNLVVVYPPSRNWNWLSSGKAFEVTHVASG